MMKNGTTRHIDFTRRIQCHEFIPMFAIRKLMMTFECMHPIARFSAGSVDQHHAGKPNSRQLIQKLSIRTMLSSGHLSTLSSSQVCVQTNEWSPPCKVKISSSRQIFALLLLQVGARGPCHLEISHCGKEGFLSRKYIVILDMPEASQ